MHAQENDVFMDFWHEQIMCAIKVILDSYLILKKINERITDS